jgi:hypothetical protein
MAPLFLCACATLPQAPERSSAGDTTFYCADERVQLSARETKVNTSDGRLITHEFSFSPFALPADRQIHCSLVFRDQDVPAARKSRILGVTVFAGVESAVEERPSGALLSAQVEVGAQGEFTSKFEGALQDLPRRSAIYFTKPHATSSPKYSACGATLIPKIHLTWELRSKNPITLTIGSKLDPLRVRVILERTPCDD